MFSANHRALVAVVQECKYHSGGFCESVRCVVFVLHGGRTDPPLTVLASLPTTSIRQVLKGPKTKLRGGTVGTVSPSLRPPLTFMRAPLSDPKKEVMALLPLHVPPPTVCLRNCVCAVPQSGFPSSLLLLVHLIPFGLPCFVCCL